MAAASSTAAAAGDGVGSSSSSTIPGSVRPGAPSPPTSAALVFGASGEQGRAVVEGLIERGPYDPVYAFTREGHDLYLTDGLGARLYTGDIENPDHVRSALSETGARCIFLVTTTELSQYAADNSPSTAAAAAAAAAAASSVPAGPSNLATAGGASDAAEAEFQVLVEFFHLLRSVYEEDRKPRHVVLSARDNVQEINRKILEETGELWIEPLDDGSIVPHYTAKGRGAQYGLEYLRDVPDLRLTLLTLPFLYSNFLGFFAPLPNDGSKSTQWTLTACFGDGDHKIDMMGASDLSVIVRE